MPEITFANERKTLFVKSGASVLEAARAAGVALESPCNGTGKCGKCRVKIHSENTLACQIFITQDTTVFIESKENENRTLKILSDGKSFSYPLKPFISKRFDGEKTIVYGGDVVFATESGDTTSLSYGIVADIGTTTLVASLVNLSDGKEVATESRLNPQSTYAQDVLSRIHFASDAAGLTTLQDVLLNAINEMIKNLAAKAGIDANFIYEVVYSGNTAMLHLACGVNPQPLGQYPYVSQIRGGERISASRLNVSPFGQIYLPPIISSFVGADITSGILALQLYEQKETVLFIDVGTNGEIMLARNGCLAATSTAAGPAFEGMNIACGMRAGNGAVESFNIADDGGVSFQAIGDVPATGICGSGLLDVAGELVRTGILEKNGRFASNAATERLRDKDGKKAYFITDNVYLSQNDVRQIQLAKGAIRSGVAALLTTLNLTANDVNRVEIAGSFGYHLNEKSLLNIGLLPPELKGKVQFVGNTAQSGGIAFLLNADFREKMTQVAADVQKIELSNNKNFQNLFIDSLRF
ncbi:MAG: ASKHA domain-containing protein [Planctomycetaceae bacterium]|jgi:uncharacterized 2Fe-2S/4Fe-4S cluster protein (DUF4445 family)|nr:ASKHA domain-containing protein [Planctomycetaceae bacterium]